MNTDDRKQPLAGQLTFDWSAEKPSAENKQTAHQTPDPLDKSSDQNDSLATPGYGPEHPWYYLKRGDNAQPLPISDIQPASYLGCMFGRDLPKSGPKRLVRARVLLKAEEEGLAKDCARYLDIVERGAEALSQFDREIAHGGDLDMARASALALKHNHISNRLGRIAILERELSYSVARWR